MEAALIGAAVFLAVLGVGGAIVIGRGSRRVALQKRLDPTMPQETETEAESGVAAFLSQVGRAVSQGKQPSRTLEQRLARAGYYDRTAAPIFMGLKILLLAVVALGTALLVFQLDILMSLKWLIVAIAGGLALFVPDMVVAWKRSRYCREVRRSLPDAIDLLEVCVSAGMGLDVAWLLVSDEIRSASPVLADEMALTNLEVHLGATRVASMRHMAERTGASEIGSLAAMLVQSERFGTSVADALRTFASSLRERRSIQSQENAEKMSVKLIIPMVLFIFPSIVAVLAGPAGIRLAKMISAH
jgi:tight adherence protein C